jgi:dihydrofolate reductase
MAAVFLDTACSIDGYWARQDGTSLYPIEEMHSSGFLSSVVDRSGAVVMSETSFNMAEDPDWYADHYELQLPIFVVTATPPAKKPQENDRLSFHFVDNYDLALEAALQAAAGRDVIVIGEASAVDAVLTLGRADEIFVRIVPLILGDGIKLFPNGVPESKFRRTNALSSVSVTHIHFERLI